MLCFRIQELDKPTECVIRRGARCATSFHELYIRISGQAPEASPKNKVPISSVQPQFSGVFPKGAHSVHVICLLSFREAYQVNEPPDQPMLCASTLKGLVPYPCETFGAIMYVLFRAARLQILFLRGTCKRHMRSNRFPS